jgi:hypothetical protein
MPNLAMQREYKFTPPGPLALTAQGAEFSPCRTWRYKLWRRWGSGPQLVAIGLNPSTADETVNDPTVAKLVRYARRWGLDGLTMLNLFAYRATLPADMKRADDPIGRENTMTMTREISSVTERGGAVLAAWGAHGSYLDRSAYTVAVLKEIGIGVACFKLTKAGEPIHPLYQLDAAVPVPFLGDGGWLCNVGRPQT